MVGVCLLLKMGSMILHGNRLKKMLRLWCVIKDFLSRVFIILQQVIVNYKQGICQIILSWIMHYIGRGIFRLYIDSLV